MQKVWLRLAGLALAASAASLLMSCQTADNEFYQPDHYVYQTPKDTGLAYEKVTFKSADGTVLSGWFIPGLPPVHGTVIHFHGNAQNMTAHYGFVSWLPKDGFNLFVFDYRGYGDSGGSPSREGVYEDSVAALRYLKTRPDIDQNKIIVFGQSLGGALALRVVGENHFAGIVGVAEESGFSSYVDVARDHFGLLALPLIAGGDAPAAAAAKISPVPLLIIHGTGDPIVAYYHAQVIYDAAKEPKELWTIPNGGHTAALGEFRAQYQPRLLQKFLVWAGTPTVVKPAAGK